MAITRPQNIMAGAESGKAVAQAVHRRRLVLMFLEGASLAAAGVCVAPAPCHLEGFE
jgi:hypothetical protein